jgi:hypothetical protein
MCIYVDMYICKYIYVDMYVHIHTHTHTYVGERAPAYSIQYICIHNTHTHTHTHTYMRRSAGASVLDTTFGREFAARPPLCMAGTERCPDGGSSMPWQEGGECARDALDPTHSSLCIYMYICICMYICIYVYIYINILKKKYMY